MGLEFVAWATFRNLRESVELMEAPPDGFTAAAEAFTRWRGVRPATRAMIDRLTAPLVPRLFEATRMGRRCRRRAARGESRAVRVCYRMPEAFRSRHRPMQRQRFLQRPAARGSRGSTRSSGSASLGGDARAAFPSRNDDEERR